MRLMLIAVAVTLTALTTGCREQRKHQSVSPAFPIHTDTNK